MLETLKNILYEMLLEKHVSLAMVFKKEGEIVWTKGRRIVGKNIPDGDGFCKTYIRECIDTGKIVTKENGIISTKGMKMSESADRLMVKSIIVYPIENDFFLYIDSGIKDIFSETDKELFKLIGKIFNSTILYILDKERMTGGISGVSKTMENIREKVLLYSITDETILLSGETGTGKNHIAKFIHYSSGRTGKFMTLNTPGIPETLLESELFGYKKGAFTGAYKDKRGLIEEAEGGTLFIDEIGEVSLNIQAKLLRLFDEKKYTRVGDIDERIANVRIISATNADLSEMIKKKLFREDLYFRISGFSISIPPLRERKQDIKPLVMENIIYLKGKKPGLEFWKVFEDYSWPGNIRELISLLKRIGIEYNGRKIGADVKNFFSSGIYEAMREKDIRVRNDIWGKFNKGETFWEVIKIPFLERELNRREVKSIINEGLVMAGGKYTELIEIFNLKDKEYKKFMNFLGVHKLQNR